MLTAAAESKDAGETYLLSQPPARWRSFHFCQIYKLTFEITRMVFWRILLHFPSQTKLSYSSRKIPSPIPSILQLMARLEFYQMLIRRWLNIAYEKLD